VRRDSADITPGERPIAAYADDAPGQTSDDRSIEEASK